MNHFAPPRRGAGSLIERAAAAYDFDTAFDARKAPPIADAFAPPPLDAPKPVPQPFAQAPALMPVPAAPIPATAEPRPIVQQTPLPKVPLAPTPVAAGGAPIDRHALDKAGMLVPGAPVSVLAEEFRLVKRQLLLTARAIKDDPARARSILVCSARPNEGKTYCAINLALSMAVERDTQVLLIDGDLAKPDVLGRLGITERPGLLDALADPRIDVESLVVTTDVPQLSVLSAGSRSNDDTELLASERTHAVIARLLAADPRRILIFDSPPALAASPASGARADCRAGDDGGARRQDFRERIASGDRIARRLRTHSAGPEPGCFHAGRATLRHLLRHGVCEMTTKLGGFVGAVALAAAIATPADARQRKITPYIEAAQVLTSDTVSDDVLTYTELSAGVDAVEQSRRVNVAISYRYSHYFGYGKSGDTDSHTGLVHGSVAVMPGVTIDGGGVATYARADIRSGSPTLVIPNQINSSQVYSADVGPSFQSHLGQIGLTGGYRFGYTKAETPVIVGTPAGAQRLDVFDSSTRHLLQANAGLKPGAVLPIGLSAGGAYEREDSSQLDQRYEGAYGRGDVIFPVTPTLALTAGVGYEKILITQRDPLVDATGAAVADTTGRYITDPNSPRRIAYDTEGVFYDAGVLYRPSPRTTFQARVGKRYDALSYTGSLAWQMSDRTGLNIGVYDGVQSFGRQLRGAIATLPANFVMADDPLGQSYNGCVFAAAGSTTAGGGCLNSALQSASTANYRARGVDATLVGHSGRDVVGVGAGYSNRKFLVPNAAPGQVIANGTDSQSAYVQALFGHQIDRVSSFTTNLSANWANSGLAGSPDIYGGSASASYNRRFGRVAAGASVGVSAFDSSQTETEVQALGRIGIRYGF